MADLSIDLFTFVWSVLFGVPIGVLLGLFGTHFIADKFAQQVFDSLLTLRRSAREQVDDYEAQAQRKEQANVEHDQDQGPAGLPLPDAEREGPADDTEA